MRSLLVLSMLTLNVIPALSQSRTADETALRAKVAALEAGINKRDYAGVGALCTTDADVIVSDGPLASGRAAIQAANQRDWGSAPAARRITITVTGIRFVGSDVAIVNTRAQFSEGAVREDRGTWLMTRQSGGDWLIAALRVMPAARQ